MFLRFFILVGYISGDSLNLSISHRNPHPSYYFPWDFHCNLSYNSKHTLQMDKYASVYTVSHNWHKPSLSTRDCSAAVELYLVSSLETHANSVITYCNAHE